MKNVYVITGGASGIGFATAKMLPKDNTLIIIAGRNEEKLKNAVEELKKEKVNATYLVCDTSIRRDVTKLAEFAKEQGIIKGVINSAGVSGTNGNPKEIIRINSLGTVYVNQEFFKVMEGGCIVDVASCSAYLLPKLLIPKKHYPLAVKNEELFLEKVSKRCKLGKDINNHCQIAYCVSKNFVTWYVQNASYKYAKEKGIRIVSISPGFVHTPMTIAEANTPGTETCLHYSGFDRGANPEEIGFLISTILDERNSYLTGTDILVDGGTNSAGFGMKAASNPNSRPIIKENW